MSMAVSISCNGVRGEGGRYGLESGGYIDWLIQHDWQMRSDLETSGNLMSISSHNTSAYQQPHSKFFIRSLVIRAGNKRNDKMEVISSFAVWLKGQKSYHDSDRSTKVIHHVVTIHFGDLAFLIDWWLAKDGYTSHLGAIPWRNVLLLLSIMHFYIVHRYLGYYCMTSSFWLSPSIAHIGNF